MLEIIMQMIHDEYGGGYDDDYGDGDNREYDSNT